MDKQSVIKKYESYKKHWEEQGAPPFFTARMARKDLIIYLEELGFETGAAHNIVKEAIGNDD